MTADPTPTMTPPDTCAPDVSGLSDREVQVLRGMARGKTNGEIGRGLFLSEDTVKTHARRLFRKLAVSDRAHAVAVAYERGILPLKPPPPPPASAPRPDRATVTIEHSATGAQHLARAVFGQRGVNDVLVQRCRMALDRLAGTVQ